ncbi:MAG TPA: hypothetical protein VE760_00055 [Acidimicrobiales bacterium]|nr:hypothetical protein [Acidimicrobiales bacterium]
MLTRQHRLAAGVAAGTAVALALAGCRGDDSSPAPAPPAPATTTTAREGGAYEAAFLGLCAARSVAASDVNSARSTFYDRSHDPLHSIARDLEPVDRALAARLLEAKEAVESDLRPDRPPPSFGPDLDRLVEVTGQALARLSLPVPRCP